MRFFFALALCLLLAIPAPVLASKTQPPDVSAVIIPPADQPAASNVISDPKWRQCALKCNYEASGCNDQCVKMEICAAEGKCDMAKCHADCQAAFKGCLKREGCNKLDTAVPCANCTDEVKKKKPFYQFWTKDE